MKSNYAYYRFFDKFLGLVCFSVPLNAAKHGGLQQIVARLMHATLQVSYTQIRSFLYYHLLVDIITILYFMIAPIEIYKLITKYVPTVQFPVMYVR